MSRSSSTAMTLAGFRREASSQGGLLDGDDPSQFNPSDPLRLWIIQVGVIILMTQLLGLGLRRIRQPSVIAEVLGGILLGPTAFGRIPGFTEHIFPQSSRPYLALVADIGLCLFLFLIGLEIEGSVVKRNARLSATIALAGMALPFGLGAALSVPLYKHFIPEEVVFTNFMLFTGVAYSITAFPVLCRILLELKLLDTTVGVVVLSAGVANDIVGWILLALAVGLVNGGGGVQALYILLTCLAFTITLLTVGRWLVHWLARKTGSIEHGPSVFFLTIVILVLFGSAFFTDVIGVSSIFGAFLAGLIVPRDNHLALSIAEKLEDVATVVFLPLYFTLSGLSTNLGLLDDGITWGFTIAILVLAYCGKMGGCTLAARTAGFSWRESSTIGSLMSCKGLIELIVLNIGLSAGILTQRVFSMFVLEALTLTFLTTPAVTALYPPHLRVRAAGTGANFATVTGQNDTEGAGTDTRSDSSGSGRRTRFAVVLDRMEHVPGMMAVTQMLRPSNTPQDDQDTEPQPTVSINALRLIEVSDSVFSGVMKSSHADEILRTDPLLGIFRMFGDLHGLQVTTAMSIVSHDDQAGSVAEHARTHDSQMIVLPWLPPWQTTEAHSTSPGAVTASGSFLNPSGVVSSSAHAHFVRGVFSQAPCAVALFVDRVRTPSDAFSGGRYHLLFPFFGGPDDRLALDFVVQLCADAKVTATVLRMVKQEISEGIDKPEAARLRNEPVLHSTIHSAHMPDTIYGHATTETRLQSATADDLAWARYTASTKIEPRTAAVEAALSRIIFEAVRTPRPLHAAVARATEFTQKGTAARQFVVTGRGRRLAAENHAPELQELVEAHAASTSAAEVRKTVGDVATAFVAAHVQVGLLVLQASLDSQD